MTDQLTYSAGNAKIPWHSFSLPSGIACPGALLCRAHVVDVDGTRSIVDGKNAEFRCHAVAAEVMYRQTFDMRQRNLAILKSLRTSDRMASALLAPLPYTSILRLHVAGDFFNQRYFDAWIKVASARPHVRFYAYTKSLNLWVARLGSIPENLVLTASMGGRYDPLIAEHNLRYARVVFSESEAIELGLPIDHDDSHAVNPGSSFATLLHGTQRAGSAASSALTRLKKSGFTGYNRKNRTTSLVVLR
jgi:hypothetical protein